MLQNGNFLSINETSVSRHSTPRSYVACSKMSVSSLANAPSPVPHTQVEREMLVMTAANHMYKNNCQSTWIGPAPLQLQEL